MMIGAVVDLDIFFFLWSIFFLSVHIWMSFDDSWLVHLAHAHPQFASLFNYLVHRGIQRWGTASVMRKYREEP